MKTVFVSGSLIIVLLGLAMALLYVGQYKMLYPAPSALIPDGLPANVERIDYPEGYGLLLTPPNDGAAPSPLIIFAHGNGELAYFWMQEFQALANHGLAVLLLEYPGYGGAEGRPSQASIQAAVLAAYDHAVARNDIDSDNIIAYGRSIGGGAAAILADKRRVRALCLESTFSSLATLVSEKGLPSFLLRDRYDNETIVRSLDVPIFLYHGAQDTLIPLHHSEALQKATKNAEMHTQPCGHNDCPRPWPELLTFLKVKLGLLENRAIDL